MLMSDENNENDGNNCQMIVDEKENDDAEDDNDFVLPNNADVLEHVSPVVELAAETMEMEIDTEVNIINNTPSNPNVNPIDNCSSSSISSNTNNHILDICQAENDNNLNFMNDQLKCDLLRNDVVDDVAVESPIRFIDDFTTPKTSKQLPMSALAMKMTPDDDDDVFSASASTSSARTSLPLSPPSAIVKKLKPVVLESLVNMNYDNIENIPEIKEIDDFITQQKHQSMSHASSRGLRKPTDGIVLTSNVDNNFLNPNNISPILKMNKIDEENEMGEDEADDDIIDGDYDFHDIRDGKELNKRKRADDSFDNLSLISTDSALLSQNYYGSAKKPKLIRTGSITRGLRRSMSFAAIKTPIANMLRSRRNSVDPNASINSITSMETTFNESIKKPVKEKLRSIKDKIYKTPKNKRLIKACASSGSVAITNSETKGSDSVKKVSKFRSLLSSDRNRTIDENEVDNASNSIIFKTPKLTYSPTSTKKYPIASTSSSHTITNMQTDMNYAGDFNLACNTNQSLSSITSSSSPTTTITITKSSQSPTTISATRRNVLTTTTTTMTTTTLLSPTTTMATSSVVAQQQSTTTTTTVYSCSDTVTIENTLCPVAETFPVLNFLFIIFLFLKYFYFYVFEKMEKNTDDFLLILSFSRCFGFPFSLFVCE